jgi:hypothetical protein
MRVFDSEITFEKCSKGGTTNGSDACVSSALEKNGRSRTRTRRKDEDDFAAWRGL